MVKASTDEIIERLKDRMGLTTDKQLCEIIDIKQNTLSTWKKRETIDFSKIISVCSKKEISLDDIFFKDKPKPIIQPLIIDGYKIEEKKLNKPKVVVLKNVKLVNTNRNIALFSTDFDCYPKIETGSIIIAQKIKHRSIKPDTAYVIEFINNNLIVDELEAIAYKDDTYKLKNCHHGNSDIVALDHIQTLWQVLGHEAKADIFENVEVGETSHVEIE